MPNATARAISHMRIKNNKKSHIVVVAPSGTTFQNNTTVNNVKDGANGDLLLGSQKISLKDGNTRLKIRIIGAFNLRPPLTDPPDTGLLKITLDNLPAAITGVDDLPVDYVDDID